jgi:hypothetical protein
LTSRVDLSCPPIKETMSALKKPVNSFSFANAGLSEDQAKSIWEALKKAIEEIQNGNASKLRFEELYRYDVVCECAAFVAVSDPINPF